MKSSKIIKPKKGMKIKVLKAPRMIGTTNIIGKEGEIICVCNRIGIKFKGKLEKGDDLCSNIHTQNGLCFSSYSWNNGYFEITEGINWKEVFQKKK